MRVEHLSIATNASTVAAANPPRRQRARRGSGWVREIRPGVWKVTVSARDDEGATVRRSRTVEGTSADADETAAALAVGAGRRAPTLDVLMRAYLAHLGKAGRSAATLRRYRQLWKDWLAPTLEHLEVSQLRAPDVENTLAAMQQRGQSRSSIHQAAVLLNSALAWHDPRGRQPRPWRLPDGARLTGTRGGLRDQPHTP